MALAGLTDNFYCDIPRILLPVHIVARTDYVTRAWRGFVGRTLPIYVVIACPVRVTVVFFTIQDYNVVGQGSHFIRHVSMTEWRYPVFCKF